MNLTPQTQGQTQKKSHSFWSNAQDITPKRVALIGGFSFIIFLTLYLLPSGEWLDNQITRPFEFRVRHWLGRDPVLDRRIKIYAYGDTTVQSLKSFDLSLKEWADVFESFEPFSPRAVFVDKLFDSPKPYPGEAEFLTRMKKLKYPVIIGAFTHSARIPGREELPPILGKTSIEIKGGEPTWIKPEALAAFGARPEMRPAFRYIGHIDYTRQFFAQLFHKLPGDKLLPHASLWVADGIENRGNKIFANGTAIPADTRGGVLINLPHPSTLFPKTIRLGDLVKSIKERESINPPPKDAVIAILPGMYTGHGDIQPTPYGNLPGGYLMVSMIHSVLAGDWLTTGHFAWPILLLWTFLGVLAGAYFSVVWLWPVVAVSLVVNVFLGLATFAYWNWELPWLFSGGAFVLSALTIYARKARRQAARAKRLQQSLEGTFSPEALKVILQSAEGLKLAPRGHQVTILFLDIVKFYLAAEKQSAEIVFSHLKELLGVVTALVHRHGGVVDKTLGDGMLAYFGYSIDDRPPYVDQAMRALRCATAIQRVFFEKAKERIPDWPPYSVRIGINTSTVYIGDLGNENRIDITLIGHGVNFAKRLETACDPYRILVGKEMYDVVEDKTIFQRRLMQVKHLSEPVEAYEYDPFDGDPAVAREVTRYDRFLGLEKSSVDKTILSRPLVANSSLAEGLITMVWAGGFEWESTKYFCRDVTLELRIGEKDSTLEAQLNQVGFLPLLAQVESGVRSVEGGYRHTLKLVNLTDVQRMMLLSYLLRTPEWKRAS